MTRQIKFRAWDVKRKRMYQVLHLHVEDDMWATVKGSNIIEDKHIHLTIQPDDIQVMQFTGLQDKNGVDIYEGDIISEKVVVDGEHMYVVCFGYVNGLVYHFVGWYIKHIYHSNGDKFTFTDYPIHMANMNRFEIIGNQQENPELLNQSK